ncbi:MAG: hydrolase [Caloramator sp.]|jgi:8-oxo-dGTP pyrophosphatase MutT (NUDIX family)|uniref:NUDIX domain-containing protein n=1 Tax=Caloramator sp. TaxID=1871330 RepID=UPI001D5B9900|nr:NUDIX domain-containing protein [Caloramator sp.]MBZ4663447.1 hydrolase [Caloramator sp.]
MKFHRAVAVYILNTKNEILLLYHKKLNTYLPPGGHVEEGELTHVAAEREALEEAGVKIEFIDVKNNLGDERATPLPTPFLVQLEDIGDHYHEDFVYLARSKSDRLINNEGHKDIGWFSIDEAYKLELFENVKKQLDYIRKIICV